jgi:hypothetical protein
MPKNTGNPKKISLENSSKPFLWEYSKFNIYNQDQLLGTVPAGTYEFLDEEVQMYNVYTVTTAWDSFESAPSNAVIVNYVGIEDKLNVEDAVNIWPNPTSDWMHLQMDLATNAHMQISILNLQGNEAALLYNANIAAGKVELSFDLSEMDLSTGIYFLKIKYNNREEIQKILFAK